MKLIIQIPCFNEEEQLPNTLEDLPRVMEGFSEVEWLVIDDGSSDRTIELARANGVDHIVKLPQNKGLAAAFQSGLDACLKLGADVIVNTDADNQYDASCIGDLVSPILSGEADLVTGSREIKGHDEFSALKIRLQLLGSWVVRKASGTEVPDATTGFRAYSREAAIQLAVVSQYTYTIESIIQAGRMNSAVLSVPIRTNPKTRDSRLFGSMWGYIRQNMLTIGRVFAAYEPIKFFGSIAFVLFGMSSIAFTPFLWDWIANGDRSGHIQSLIVAAIFAVAGFQMVVVAIVADLIASHRMISQRVFERVRRIELQTQIPPSHYYGKPPSSTPARRLDDSAPSTKPS